MVLQKRDLRQHLILHQNLLKVQEKVHYMDKTFIGYLVLILINVVLK